MIINLYQFDNANPQGDKEAVIVPNVPTLVNKLSANEINGIRNKINDIIPYAIIGGAPIAFLELRLKLKGSQGGIPNTLNTLQIGDVVTGFKEAGVIWNNAIYLGGDPTDRNNYTPMGEVSFEPILIVATATGVNQVFQLPDGYIVGSVLKSRSELYKDVEWSQTDDTLTIIVNTNVGNSIYIKP